MAVQNFWGIDPASDPVVKQVTYEKDVAKFYGVKEESGSCEEAKAKQTKQDVVNIFFAVSEKESGKYLIQLMRD